MSHRTLPDPPLSTPLFPALNVRELLRAGAEAFGFKVSRNSNWGGWLGEVADHINPIVVKTTLDFGNTLAQTSTPLTVAVPGADTDHFVEVVPPVALQIANSSWDAYVSATGVVTVRFLNFSAGAINPASGEFTLIIRGSVA